MALVYKLISNVHSSFPAHRHHNLLVCDGDVTTFSSMKSFINTYSVNLMDIDSQYNFSINALISYFEDTISRHLAAGKIGPLDVYERNMFWMITEFHAHLSDLMPRWSDIIRVEVSVSELSTYKAYVDFNMSTVQGLQFASGTSVWVLSDVTTRKPVSCFAVPDLLCLYDDAHRVRHTRFLFQRLTQAEKSFRHTVTTVDTDFNGHMNNQVYVRLALSMATFGFVRGHALRQIHVKFVQQSFLGEEIEFNLQSLDNGRFLTPITKLSDGTSVCQIVSVWSPSQAS